MTPPRRPNPTDVVLRPGDTCFEQRPLRIRTLLGSCVAIAVWHPQRRIGGMCHFMLPTRGHRNGDVVDAASVSRELAAQVPGSPLDGRYAVEAMALLLRGIDRCGSLPCEYEAKLFGGGRMFACGCDVDVSVQQANVDVARALVRDNGLRLRAEHMGGAGHREVVLDLQSGAVWVRHTPPRDVAAPLPASAP